ncbi:hypothetical protein FRACA_150040 [Frankia canadensis]|uniref:Uncharacterized protein n=1 Tax=Frankia canadensis TaxID=1836972 RepID=A0A2I2KLX7_9ACTN|nr:hypothetical protein FRACA_150040 [Frankia canadensis]SOU53958.1 hypothetical protein FRACA_150040 [Frankia canadensis]
MCRRDQGQRREVPAVRRVVAVHRHPAQQVHRVRGGGEGGEAVARRGEDDPRGRARARLHRGRQAHRGPARRRPRRALDDAPVTTVTSMRGGLRAHGGPESRAAMPTGRPRSDATPGPAPDRGRRQGRHRLPRTARDAWAGVRPGSDDPLGAATAGTVEDPPDSLHDPRALSNETATRALRVPGHHLAERPDGGAGRPDRRPARRRPRRAQRHILVITDGIRAIYAA